MQQFPAVGIVGPRQVGKTSLARKIAAEIEKETIYLDLESPSDFRTLTNDIEWFLLKNENYTLIIDEVQQYLPLFPVLRSVIDKNRQNGRFILLGSASPAFLSNSSETLAGRISFTELTPITISEYNQPQELWFRGGFPNALLANGTEQWFDWQESFVQTYIERDLGQLGMNATINEIRRLMYMLAALNGNLLNYQNLSNSLQIDQRTLKKYLDILEQAFLIRILQPWNVNVNKRLTKSPKLFLRDTGNLHYLRNISDFKELTLSPMVGHSWESFVIEQISSSLKSNVQAYFYRTHNGAEVDMVLVKGIEPLVSIEIKLSMANRPGRGNTIATQDLKTPNNFIVVQGKNDL